MMKKIVFFLLFIPFITLSQHSISGTFAPAEKYSKAFLYKVEVSFPQYVSYTSIESDGTVSLTLPESLEPGMYRIVCGLPEDEYYFDFLYNGSEDVVFHFEYEKGASFSASKENMILQEYKAKIDEAQKEINTTFDPDISKKTFLNAFQAIENIQNDYEKQSEGMIVHHYIRTGRLPIPLHKIDLETFKNLEKEHFFDHIDFNDPFLQNSDYLKNASLIYTIRFADSTQSETYFENIDRIAAKAGDNPLLKKSIFEKMWYHFSEDNNMPVANYIADNYLKSLTEEFGDKKLLIDINTYQNTAIGATAPDFDLGDSEMMSELNNAEHYLLIFWSSTCSHCLKELPQVKTFLQTTDTDTVQVIAFGLEDGDLPWKESIKAYPRFIHVFGEGKWENPVSNTYGVMQTPTYIILDVDKKIVAKPESLDDLKKKLKTLIKS
ncbi:TlpA disulfide reductase family protein [Galbibacter sp. EGI 63066]|uniref:TlpA family protein disulfide reductase n=1 Tax=Galbibacter sp. EGI 63066 TaxID=2993559 RepID=UPI0022490051|nr:TlpA disulfide reductase family protein [Galbibacter sp. EGI 63066]MCX2680923.1 TlpA disulfide reductase family protein [Galbibacter sp. EGI 63066]